MPESRSMSRKKRKQLSREKVKKSQKPDNQDLNDLNRIEFHRNGFTLVPDSSEKNPGIAYYLKWNNPESDEMMCSCHTYKRKPCVHILHLVDLYRSFKLKTGGRTPEEDFHKSIW